MCLWAGRWPAQTSLAIVRPLYRLEGQRGRGSSAHESSRLQQIRVRGEPYIIRAMTGLRKPKTTRPGVDLAGQVEAVGRNVTQFQPGDEVFIRREQRRLR